ncbi:hypothetical protein EBR66_00925 [bacterium]|nr:hypothetical protein [bacterium]
MTALSVESPGAGKSTGTLDSSVSRERKYEFAATPPPTKMHCAPCSSVARRVFETSTSTIDSSVSRAMSARISSESGWCCSINFRAAVLRPEKEKS